MFVPVVRIRHMRVRMRHRLMHVGMAVRADRHRIVGVAVVAVVVAVRVLVFQPLMRMLVPVRLRQVQHYPQHHQQAAHRHDPGAAAVTKRNGDRGANERREGEH